MVVPVAIREALSGAGETLLVLHENLFNNCINLYTKTSWERLIADIQTPRAPLSRQESDFVREFSRGTAAVTPDESSGRILVPRKMLDRLGATDALLLAGQGARLEIWEPTRYEQAALPPEQRAAMAEEIYQRLSRQP
jgi:MraZ protein